MRKRRGISNFSFTPVTWALECPVHLGEVRLEYPVGAGLPTASGADVTYESQRVYCPQEGGHTFNVEDAKATTFNDDGSVSASGVVIGTSFLLA